MFEAEVIARGRITIPAQVRDAWAIVEGDHLVLMLVKNHGSLIPKKAETPKQ